MSCRGLEKNCTSKSFCTKDHDGTHELWMGNSIIFDNHAPCRKFGKIGNCAMLKGKPRQNEVGVYK